MADKSKKVITSALMKGALNPPSPPKNPKRTREGAEPSSSKAPSATPAKPKTSTPAGLVPRSEKGKDPMAGKEFDQLADGQAFCLVPEGQKKERILEASQALMRKGDVNHFGRVDPDVEYLYYQQQLADVYVRSQLMAAKARYCRRFHSEATPQAKKELDDYKLKALKLERSLDAEKERAKKTKIANDKALMDLHLQIEGLQTRVDTLTFDNKAIKLKAAEDIRKAEYDPDDWADYKQDLTLSGFNAGVAHSLKVFNRVAPNFLGADFPLEKLIKAFHDERDRMIDEEVQEGATAELVGENVPAEGAAPEDPEPATVAEEKLPVEGGEDEEEMPLRKKKKKTHASKV